MWLSLDRLVHYKSVCIKTHARKLSVSLPKRTWDFKASCGLTYAHRAAPSQTKQKKTNPKQSERLLYYPLSRSVPLLNTRRSQTVLPGLPDEAEGFDIPAVRDSSEHRTWLQPATCYVIRHRWGVLHSAHRAIH